MDEEFLRAYKIQRAAKERERAERERLKAPYDRVFRFRNLVDDSVVEKIPKIFFQEHESDIAEEEPSGDTSIN